MGQRCALAVVVAAAALLVLPARATAGCRPSSVDEHATVDFVYDGDTVRLDDGRDVRLVGVNTPELGHDDGPDQPLAARARRRLRAWLHASEGRIGIEIARERHDHYGRLLAHVYTADGRSITRRLLAQGLGWQIAIPPNLVHRQCYARAEAHAREDSRGVWGESAYGVSASSLAQTGGGFHVVNGRIQAVNESKQAWWLELDGFAVRLPKDDLHWFGGAEPRDWRGRRLRIRGWVYRVHGDARMDLRHPLAVYWLRSHE